MKYLKKYNESIDFDDISEEEYNDKDEYFNSLITFYDKKIKRSDIIKYIAVKNDKSKLFYNYLLEKGYNLYDDYDYRQILDTYYFVIWDDMVISIVTAINRFIFVCPKYEIIKLNINKLL